MHRPRLLQFFCAQILDSNSHLVPMNPLKHLQLIKPLGSMVQLPFLQILNSQYWACRTISKQGKKWAKWDVYDQPEIYIHCSHLCPVKSGLQLHMKLMRPIGRQVPPFSHCLFKQRFEFSQLVPEYPSKQINNTNLMLLVPVLKMCISSSAENVLQINTRKPGEVCK